MSVSNTVARPTFPLAGSGASLAALEPAVSPPHAAAPHEGATRLTRALRLGAPETGIQNETVACETPVELRINGRSHTILMASPAQLKELALGYCLSEGLVQRGAQVRGVELGEVDLPATGPAHWVNLSLDPELARRAKARRLSPAATSCSLCGLASFKDLPRDLTPVTDSGPTVELDCVFTLLAAMESSQGVFSHTGGTHAAALGTSHGTLISAAEDIGRHNALDKAVGLAFHRNAENWDMGDCMVVLSGRLSYEMALKVARLGIPLVASVSAPTELAVRLLDVLGVTLIAFCRPPRATVYTHPGRLAWSPQI